MRTVIRDIIGHIPIISNCISISHPVLCRASGFFPSLSVFLLFPTYAFKCSEFPFLLFFFSDFPFLNELGITEVTQSPFCTRRWCLMCLHWSSRFPTPRSLPRFFQHFYSSLLCNINIHPALKSFLQLTYIYRIT